MKARLLLLEEDIVCGIFKLPREEKTSVRVTVRVVLSPSGEYCAISRDIGEEYENIHRTAFVPSRFFEMVKRVVLFRNKFAVYPFVHDRFQPEPSNLSEFA